MNWVQTWWGKMIGLFPEHKDCKYIEVRERLKTGFYLRLFWYLKTWSKVLHDQLSCHAYCPLGVLALRQSYQKQRIGRSAACAKTNLNGRKTENQLRLEAWKPYTIMGKVRTSQRPGSTFREQSFQKLACDFANAPRRGQSRSFIFFHHNIPLIQHGLASGWSFKTTRVMWDRLLVLKNAVRRKSVHLKRAASTFRETIVSEV